MSNKNISPFTGNFLNSDDETVNLIDLLKSKGASAASLYDDKVNTLNTQPAFTGNMVGSDDKVYNIIDLISSMSGGSSGGAVDSVNGKTGAVVLTGADINVSTDDTTTVSDKLTTLETNVDTMGGTVETLDNDVEELGTQVAEIQTTVNAIPNTYATKAEIPVATSDLTNDSGFITSAALSGYAQTSSLATVATSGSYNDLSNKPTIPEAYTLPAATTSTLGGVKPDGTTITVTADGTISAAAQPAVQSITNPPYQIFQGVPTADPVTVGTTLARTLIPQTVKIPTTNSDFTLSDDSCGIICNKAGVVHIKRIVTVGTATTSNIYQTLYKNQESISNGQTFIHSAGCLSLEVDFYTDVVANDELCIMANTTQTEFTINYSEITFFIEYL